MPFTENARNEMLDDQGATRDIALYVGEPPGGTEVTGTGYSRQSATMGTAATGARSNTNQVQFDNAGNTDWNNNVSHWAGYSGGVLKTYGPLQATRDMSIANATLTFGIGDIDESVT